MSIATFKGFGGVRLEAEISGVVDDPAVLLLHGSGQSRAVWAEASQALVSAGRQVINLDLRGHGGSAWAEDGRYAFDAFVEDLQAVLNQLGTRPVIVAATLGGWIATAALGNDAANLAAGLVLVDLPTQIDPQTTQRVADRLKAQPTDTGDGAHWDMRLFNSFDVSDVSQILRDAAPRINVPVLLVRGALSDLSTRDQTAEFVALLPHAEFAEVEDAGLLMREQRTDIFSAILLDFLESKMPRTPPEYRSGSDARTFRAALGCFATGVTVVTAMDSAGVPLGLTANSFTSVSLDPPMLLVCIAKNAGSAPVMESTARFAVNVLQIGQQPTSNRFAGKGEDRFAATPWEIGEFGTPVLTGSLASFECERSAVHDGGDHFILVGQVLRAIYEPRRDPLLYFKGKYRRLHFG